MSLTPKQFSALQDAFSNPRGEIFQLPENRKHNPGVLASLVKQGLLKAERVGVVWAITPAGRDAFLSAQKEH